MTLLITIFAAIITTIIWYKKAPDDNMRVGTLSLMYIGASLMWTIDAIFEYAELGTEFFNPSFHDMINDTYLGLCVVAFGLLIWMVSLIIKDPKGIIKKNALR